MFYVFQHYLSLYTTIFKNFISYYFFENFIKQNLKDLNENDLNDELSLENKGRDNEREKEFHVIEKDFYEEHSATRIKGAGNNGMFINSNIITILSKIPYLKRLNAFSSIDNSEVAYSMGSSKKKDEQKEYFKSQKNIPFSHTINSTNMSSLPNEKKFDKILHVTDSQYVPKYSSIFSRS